MLDAVDSYMRDKDKATILSPLLFTEHSIGMLAGGLKSTMKKTAYVQVLSKVIYWFLM